MDFELVLALNLGYLLGVKRCLNFTTKYSSRLTKIKQLSLDCYNSFLRQYHHLKNIIINLLSKEKTLIYFSDTLEKVSIFCSCTPSIKF